MHRLVIGIGVPAALGPTKSTRQRTFGIQLCSAR